MWYVGIVQNFLHNRFLFWWQVNFNFYLVGHIFILFVASTETVSYCLSGRLSFAPKSHIYCSVNTTNDRCALQSNTSVMFEDFSIHFWLQWGANYRAAEGIFPRFFFIIHDTVRDRLLCKWIFICSIKKIIILIFQKVLTVPK